jgi:hypothetical protein
MKLFFALLFVSVAVVAAQDPVNILIYSDSFGGYGDDVFTTVSALWPSANVMAYHDAYTGPTAFNTDMNTYGNNLDIVIMDCWCGFYSDFNWDVMTTLYNSGNVKFCAFCWKWGSSPACLANAMGVSGFGDITTVIPHYSWDNTHPITAGITDWGWAEPGVGVKGSRMTVTNAIPVTGWLQTSAAGNAGLCVANDGRSVVSGYTLAFANQSAAIWNNVLNFIWNGTQPLQRDTWADIKTSF